MTSLIHLEAIERVEYSDLREKMILHALAWNINKKCDCVKNVKNPSFENMIVCRHIEQDRIKKFQEKIKKGLADCLKINMAKLLSDLQYSRN